MIEFLTNIGKGKFVYLLAFLTGLFLSAFCVTILQMPWWIVVGAGCSILSRHNSAHEAIARSSL